MNQREPQARPADGALSTPSALYLAVVAAAAAAAATVALSGLDGDERWTEFALCAAAAAIAQLLVVPSGRNHAYDIAVLFVAAGALLLPLPLVALLGLAQHSAAGVRNRYPWYIFLFNIANATLSALAAWGAAHAIRGAGLPGELGWTLGAAAAAVALVGVNHTLLALMLRFARNRPLRESGLLSFEGLSMELLPAVSGIALAWFWGGNRWLTPLAVAPLLLAQRTYAILARLRESEERFRAMFESAAVGAALLELDGRIVTTNRALEQMLGYTKDELVDQPFGTLAHVEDAERESARLRELVAGLRDDYHGETRYADRDGGIVFGNTAAALVLGVEQKPRYAIAMVENVTARRELEERLRQSHKLEAVGRLAGGIAHDFNNVLTAITGYAHLVLYRADAGMPLERDEIEEIRNAAERGASLTGQLLAFSRKQVLQPRVLDLNAVVRDLDKMVRRLIGEDIVVKTSLQPGLGHLTADPSQLQQVIVNLAVNARDAMIGGGTLELETYETDVVAGEPNDEIVPGRYAVLRVADTGHGMDDEIQARSFEPFFTTKRNGTGLGLATVYGIVKQSGGFIELDSAPGCGTTYRIHLPVTAGRELAEELDRGRDGDQPTPATVLLVEDESVVRTMIRQVLRSAGHTVHEAPNGVAALELLDQHDFEIDLLVTDVVMPEMSGFELAERVAARSPQTRILYISGHTGTTPAGDFVFLQKPFAPSELMHKLAEAQRSPQRLAVTS
jgi:two-component system cell cycle sensor histidine kinase/response regulator CckA